MNWYYVEAGQQAGPVDETQLNELSRSGKIQPDTLVWREGMTEWQPYSAVKPAGATIVAEAPPVYAAGPVIGAGQAVCAECNGVFDLQDTIPYGNIRVCAHCKPVFMQKLAEGARINTGTMTYAGFWIRFAAVFLDGIILQLVNLPIQLVIGFSFGQAIGTEPRGTLALQAISTAISFGIGITYEVLMIGKYGATLGKMACKIKVVTADGLPVSYGLALGRYFAKLLSALTCLIGYIMAGFDEQKRALHDRICNTRVVMK